MHHLRESFDVVDRLLRFGAVLVVGIDIRGADNAPAVDQEPSRHRQGPAALTVANRQVIAKAKINPLEIIGQREPETELRGVGIAGSDSRSKLILCFSIRDRLASASCGVIATIVAPCSLRVFATCCKAYSSATQ